MKKGQKAVTTAPEKHNNEGKGKKSEEEERRRREKSNGYTLGFYNGYSSVWLASVSLALFFSMAVLYLDYE